MLNLPIKRHKQGLSKLSSEYYIAGNIKAVGELAAEHDIFIDCVYDGDINSHGLVELSNNSKVSGEVNGRVVIISGDFHGRVNAEDKLIIRGGARVKGDFVSRSIEVHDGALINGRVKMVSA